MTSSNNDHNSTGSDNESSQQLPVSGSGDNGICSPSDVSFLNNNTFQKDKESMSQTAPSDNISLSFINTTPNNDEVASLGSNCGGSSSSKQDSSIDCIKHNRSEDNQPVLVTQNGSYINGTHRPIGTDFIAGSKSKSTFYTVSLIDVNYSVKASFRSKKKQVLHEVTAHFEPGLNGILGPSGSGKTTILDLVACHKEMQLKHLTGQLLVNGNPICANTFRAISAYVPQEDHLSEFLTVKENLMFSANMRMVGKSSVEKVVSVERMIELLHLERCQNTLIGNYLIRGVSTGEKKRTCIAMELLLEPDILMLDEPTTGLDSYSANEIVNCLTHIANHSNKTIIMSLHQPRYAIFKKLDNLTLLTVDGRLAYHGAAAEAKSYFVSHGYFCEEAENPCDFFLDLVQSYAYEALIEDKLNEVTADNNDKKRLCMETTNQNQRNSNIDLEDRTTTVVTISNKKFDDLSTKTNKAACIKHTLSHLFLQSQPFKQMKQKIEDSLNMDKINATKNHQPFSTQMKFLFTRDVRSLYRNPECLFGQVVIATLLSLLFGALYWQTELSPDRGFQNRHGLFFFLSLSLMMMNLAHVELFISQQKLFFHEYANGYFYLLPYFLSNVLFDLITLRVVPALIFGFTLTYSVGLRSDFDHLFFFLVMLVLLAVSGCGVSYLVTSLLKTFYLSHICVILIFVVMMVFAGLLINLKTLPEWVEGIKYLSLVYYGVSGLSVNEFVGLDFCGRTSVNEACPGIEMALANADTADMSDGSGNSGMMSTLLTPETLRNVFSQRLELCVKGEAGLTVQGIDYENFSKWFYALMVAVGALISYTLTFVRLYFSNRR